MLPPGHGIPLAGRSGDAVFEIFRIEHAPQHDVAVSTGEIKTTEELEQQEETTEELF